MSEMMRTAVATPRPWRVREVSSAGRENEPNIYIAGAEVTDDLALMCYGYDIARERANAALIVAAANAYQPMVDALRDELEALDVWLSDENNAIDDVREGMLISRSKLLAALALTQDAAETAGRL